MSQKYIKTGDLTKVVEWDRNPRRDALASTEELQESLRRVGLQDAIHVWQRGANAKELLLLKGHRRVNAMRAIGWKECAMVVHDFADEQQAFLFLLQDHGHTVSLNIDERILAAENGSALGIELGKLADALGVSQERVQLWLDLAGNLPESAREAMASGVLGMNTAEMVLRVARDVGEDAAAAAVQMVLHDPVSGEPMSGAMARAAIEAKYLQPRRWHAEWIERMGAMAKTHPVSAGYVFEPFERRWHFCQGESGQPWRAYEYADGFMPSDPKGRRWGEVACELGVPVHVVAAPRCVDGCVMLVERELIETGLDMARDGAGGSGKAARRTEPKPDARGWWHASETLPDDQITVLVWGGDEVLLGYHQGEDWWDSPHAARHPIAVTHWQDVPAEPVGV